MEFKRFSADKQEQIRQFVAYAQMMGLSGKDIRSIGDKLDRMNKAEIKRANLEIVQGYECLPIGADRNLPKGSLEEQLDCRFKLKTARGAYNFSRDYSRWKVTSLTTKVTNLYIVSPFKYELGQGDWYRQARYAVLLDINAGNIVLDF